MPELLSMLGGPSVENRRWALDRLGASAGEPLLARALIALAPHDAPLLDTLMPELVEFARARLDAEEHERFANHICGLPRLHRAFLDWLVERLSIYLPAPLVLDARLTRLPELPPGASDRRSEPWEGHAEFDPGADAWRVTFETPFALDFALPASAGPIGNPERVPVTDLWVFYELRDEVERAPALLAHDSHLDEWLLVRQAPVAAARDLYLQTWARFEKILPLDSRRHLPAAERVRTSRAEREVLEELKRWRDSDEFEQLRSQLSRADDFFEELDGFLSERAYLEACADAILSRGDAGRAATLRTAADDVDKVRGLLGKMRAQGYPPIL